MDAPRDDRQEPDHGTDGGGGSVREAMESSARALLLAEQAHVHEAMDSVRWERRGLLQRLTRDRHAG